MIRRIHCWYQILPENDDFLGKPQKSTFLAQNIWFEKLQKNLQIKQWKIANSFTFIMVNKMKNSGSERVVGLTPPLNCLKFVRYDSWNYVHYQFI